MILHLEWFFSVHTLHFSLQPATGQISWTVDFDQDHWSFTSKGSEKVEFLYELQKISLRVWGFIQNVCLCFCLCIPAKKCLNFLPDGQIWMKFLGWAKLLGRIFWAEGALRIRSGPCKVLLLEFWTGGHTFLATGGQSKMFGARIVILSYQPEKIGPEGEAARPANFEKKFSNFYF